MKLLCGSLSGTAARRRAQGMAVALAKCDNNAAVPDRPRPAGPSDEPTGFVDLP